MPAHKQNFHLSKDFVFPLGRPPGRKGLRRRARREAEVSVLQRALPFSTLVMIPASLLVSCQAHQQSLDLVTRPSRRRAFSQASGASAASPPNQTSPPKGITTSPGRRSWSDSKAVFCRTIIKVESLRCFVAESDSSQSDHRGCVEETKCTARNETSLAQRRCSSEPWQGSKGGQG